MRINEEKNTSVFVAPECLCEESTVFKNMDSRLKISGNDEAAYNASSRHREGRFIVPRGDLAFQKRGYESW